jgi:hypothetical protein
MNVLNTALLGLLLLSEITVNDNHQYVEYLPGDMPLILSIPHGGYLIPEEIPERPCINCAKNQDIYTLEIGLDLRQMIYKITGHYPYVIINHLHRTRLDPNRNIEEAASGHPLAEIAWAEFHKLIDSASNEVERRFGKGLYIDLHGHRHAIKRTELGYLLSSDELQLEDDFLNFDTFTEFSSIRSLAEGMKDSVSFTQLIRGPKSLGSLLEERGYPTVPSEKIHSPEPDEPYFSGGFNTMQHGSSSGGRIDGIQIELDIDLRSDEKIRNRFASDLAEILIQFLDIYYFPALF